MKPDCPYVGDCEDEGVLCPSCTLNSKKHYIPRDILPYYPSYHLYYPNYYPTYTTYTITNT